MQTYTSPLGTVHTVPTGMNRKRKGETGIWGNSSGSDAIAARDRHILRDVVPLLGLRYDPSCGWLQAVCGCLTASRSHDVEPIATSWGPVMPAKFEADRALTAGDPDAPYAPGLIIPVCQRHNGSNARLEALGYIRNAAERVARHFTVEETK